MRPSFSGVRLAALLGLVLSASPVLAQRVGSRADLATYLGASAVTEDFEDVTFSGASLFLRAPVLSAATSTPQFPAGRIAPGLEFRNGNEGHEFFAANPGIGLATRTYVGYSSEAEILLPGGARAIGLDMIARFFANPQPGSVTFFGAGGQTIGRIDARLTEMVPTFLGWRSEDDLITRVRFSGFSTTGATTMHLDDVTFGAGATTVTPEPATLVLLAGGLVALGGVAARRRRAA